MARRKRKITLAGGAVTVYTEREPDIRAVVLSQPHRRGNMDQKCASAWGRFVIRNKFSEAIFSAGEEYGGVARRYRKLHGISSNTADANGHNGGDADPETISKLKKQMYGMECIIADHSMAALLLMRRMLLDDEDIGSSLDRVVSPAATSLAIHLGLMNACGNPFASSRAA